MDNSQRSNSSNCSAASFGGPVGCYQLFVLNDKFVETSDLELYTDIILGILMSMFTVIGVVANISVVVLFTKKRKTLLTRTTYLLRSLALGDGVMAAVGGIMFTVSCFQHRWAFSKAGCVFYAMMMYWCGVTSIAHLCLISVERCVTFCNLAWSVANRNRIPSYVTGMVIFCWLYGLFWAVLPLAGIQSYTIEGRVSCSLNWFSRELDDIIYNAAIFAAVFLIPGLVIICSCGVIFYTVRTSLMRQIGDTKKQRQQKMEWKLTKVLMCTTGFYMIAWTPYAIISMWASFGDPVLIPPILFTWLAFFAKTSFIFNPLVYVGMNSAYRRELSKLVLRGYFTMEARQRDNNSNTSFHLKQPSLRFVRNDDEQAAPGRDASGSDTHQMSMSPSFTAVPSTKSLTSQLKNPDNSFERPEEGHLLCSTIIEEDGQLPRVMSCPVLIVNYKSIDSRRSSAGDKFADHIQPVFAAIGTESFS